MRNIITCTIASVRIVDIQINILYITNILGCKIRNKICEYRTFITRRLQRDQF